MQRNRKYNSQEEKNKPVETNSRMTEMGLLVDRY